MSSTNKTTKLGLSQFLGTDKPAWLGDYNSDMQKIDDAFAQLKQGGESSAADIEALQQKDESLTQDIADVDDRVDTVSTDMITVGNRTTVLEGNYDTMHHELVLIEADVDANTKKLETIRADRREIYVNATAGNDNNNGTSSEPIATINRAFQIVNSEVYNQYRIRLAAGIYQIENRADTNPHAAKITIQGENKNTTVIEHNIRANIYMDIENMNDVTIRLSNANETLYMGSCGFQNCKIDAVNNSLKNNGAAIWIFNGECVLEPSANNKPVFSTGGLAIINGTCSADIKLGNGTLIAQTANITGTIIGNGNKVLM